ncbi:isochorismatase family cysteine hydrolase [Terricaulis sp.]|uniref:cysteine hydrolase family protein n=1 Tax=Terricaulis sp. TaxID=2768686 RepID=UPI002AC4BF79|nr:isochorismatase family cysteine hydrolase [Terricaulis sp.]MDZ4690949.1 isochorismatase family cysteine hydrolase [Terricaulis sp.]
MKGEADLEGLRHGPLSASTVHLCIDMQCLFAEATEWQTPWMKRVLPNVEALVSADPSKTIFSRFIPAAHPGEGRGAWARYWRRWSSMTRDHLPDQMIELVPELARFAPPATIIDKKYYSPWIDTALDIELKRLDADTLIISGGETDVCVLAAVLGAVDRGYRVVIASDALCSSSDQTHDALMMLYHQRYTEQVETVSTKALIAAWKPA